MLILTNGIDASSTGESLTCNVGRPLSHTKLCSAFHLRAFTVLYVSKIKPCPYIFSYQSRTHSTNDNEQIEAEDDSRREFNGQWENELLLIAGPSGKQLCIVCENIFPQNGQHDLNRHHKTQHQTEVEGKLKLVPGSELRKECVIEKEEEIRRR